MPDVAPCPLPETSLLRPYVARGYVDCYATDIAGSVTQAKFIEAFYTTAVFRVERLILKWAVTKPSTDADVRALAAGIADSFAAWTVEARADNQLLLCDYLGRTRSWLMVEPMDGPGSSRTRLYFGSAVVRRPPPGQDTEALEFRFRGLLGFHKLYSRALLAAARSRLSSQARTW